MPATVLDSYALIAYFRGEPAGFPVKEFLQKAGKADKPVHMTEVNYAEAHYMILRKDGAEVLHGTGCLGFRIAGQCTRCRVEADLPRQEDEITGPDPLAVGPDRCRGLL